MQLSDFWLVVIVNENHKDFLFNLIDSLEQCSYPIEKLIICDVGLKTFHRREYVVLKFKETNTYGSLIDNRTKFLRRVTTINNGEPILQLDADTFVIKKEFPDIDETSDLILTVRKAEDEHVNPRFKHFQNNYPNLGVTFWVNPCKCFPLWDEWDKIKSSNKPIGGQYEQSRFLMLMETNIFKTIKTTFLPCEQYNCYKYEWLNEDTKIVHFKNKEGRLFKGSLKPNYNMLVKAITLS